MRPFGIAVPVRTTAISSYRSSIREWSRAPDIYISMRRPIELRCAFVHACPDVRASDCSGCVLSIDDRDLRFPRAQVSRRTNSAEKKHLPKVALVSEKSHIVTRSLYIARSCASRADDTRQTSKETNFASIVRCAPDDYRDNIGVTIIERCRSRASVLYIRHVSKNRWGTGKRKEKIRFTNLFPSVSLRKKKILFLFLIHNKM